MHILLWDQAKGWIEFRFWKIEMKFDEQSYLYCIGWILLKGSPSSLCEPQHHCRSWTKVFERRICADLNYIFFFKRTSQPYHNSPKSKTKLHLQSQVPAPSRNQLKKSKSISSTSPAQIFLADIPLASPCLFNMRYLEPLVIFRYIHIQISCYHTYLENLLI